MKVPLRVNEMKAHWRQVGTLAILLNRILRRNQTYANNDRVHHTKEDQPSHAYAQQLHRGWLSVRILGSAQYRSKSARKFPPTRKRVENRMPPMTTYKSRARMASNKNGPSPGQLITTSMS